jgi:hypothetical protein
MMHDHMNVKNCCHSDLRVKKSTVISCASAECKCIFWETFAVSIYFPNVTVSVPGLLLLGQPVTYHEEQAVKRRAHVGTVLLVHAKLGTPCCMWMFQYC